MPEPLSGLTKESVELAAAVRGALTEAASLGHSDGRVIDASLRAGQSLAARSLQWPRQAQGVEEALRSCANPSETSWSEGQKLLRFLQARHGQLGPFADRAALIFSLWKEAHTQALSVESASHTRDFWPAARRDWDALLERARTVAAPALRAAWEETPGRDSLQKEHEELSALTVQAVQRFVSVWTPKIEGPIGRHMARTAVQGPMPRPGEIVLPQIKLSDAQSLVQGIARRFRQGGAERDVGAAQLADLFDNLAAASNLDAEFQGNPRGLAEVVAAAQALREQLSAEERPNIDQAAWRFESRQRELPALARLVEQIRAPRIQEASIAALPIPGGPRTAALPGAPVQNAEPGEAEPAPEAEEPFVWQAVAEAAIAAFGELPLPEALSDLAREQAYETVGFSMRIRRIKNTRALVEQLAEAEDFSLEDRDLLVALGRAVRRRDEPDREPRVYDLGAADDDARRGREAIHRLRRRWREIHRAQDSGGDAPADWLREADALLSLLPRGNEPLRTRNPAFRRYEDELEAARGFHMASLADERVPFGDKLVPGRGEDRGTELTLGELPPEIFAAFGLDKLPSGSRVFTHRHADKPGFLVRRGDQPVLFVSLDGLLAAEFTTDPNGEITERREIRDPLDPRTEIYGIGRDGSRGEPTVIRRMGEVVTAIDEPGPDGKVQRRFMFATKRLLAADPREARPNDGPGIYNEHDVQARQLALTVAEHAGADNDQMRMLTAWLRDTPVPQQGVSSMQLFYDPDGTYQLVIQYDGHKVIQTARFAEGTRVNEGRRLEHPRALVISEPLVVRPNGQTGGSPRRFLEYQEDGKVVSWSRLTRDNKGSSRWMGIDWTHWYADAKEETEVSATLWERQEHDDGRRRFAAWRQAMSRVMRQEERSLVNERTGEGRGFFSEVERLPGLKHIGEVGSGSFNYIVGWNQLGLGTLTGNVRSRLDGQAAVARAESWSRERIRSHIAHNLDAEEREMLDIQVRKRRAEDAAANNWVDENGDPIDPTVLYQRPITDAERFATFSSLGAGNYGAELGRMAQMAADPRDQVALMLGSIAMGVGEQTAQSLPLTLVTAGLAKGADIAHLAQRGLTGWRAGLAALSVRSTQFVLGGLEITDVGDLAQGVLDMVEGLSEGRRDTFAKGFSAVLGEQLSIFLPGGAIGESVPSRRPETQSAVPGDSALPDAQASPPPVSPAPRPDRTEAQPATREPGQKRKEEPLPSDPLLQDGTSPSPAALPAAAPSAQPSSPPSAAPQGIPRAPERAPAGSPSMRPLASSPPAAAAPGAAATAGNTKFFGSGGPTAARSPSAAPATTGKPQESRRIESASSQSSSDQAASPRVPASVDSAAPKRAQAQAARRPPAESPASGTPRDTGALPDSGPAVTREAAPSVFPPSRPPSRQNPSGETLIAQLQVRGASENLRRSETAAARETQAVGDSLPAARELSARRSAREYQAPAAQTSRPGLASPEPAASARPPLDQARAGETAQTDWTRGATRAPESGDTALLSAPEAAPASSHGQAAPVRASASPPPSGRGAGSGRRGLIGRGWDLLVHGFTAPVRLVFGRAGPAASTATAAPTPQWAPLLGNSRVLVLGEQHENLSVLERLAEEMPRLREAGVTHAALEGFGPEHQAAIDQFLAGQSDVVPDFSADNSRAGEYRALFEAARRSGVRLIAPEPSPARLAEIERAMEARIGDDSFSGQQDARDAANIEGRNGHFADRLAQILKKDPASRVLFLVGSDHAEAIGEKGPRPLDDPGLRSVSAALAARGIDSGTLLARGGQHVEGSRESAIEASPDLYTHAGESGVSQARPGVSVWDLGPYRGPDDLAAMEEGGGARRGPSPLRALYARRAGKGAPTGAQILARALAADRAGADPARPNVVGVLKDHFVRTQKHKDCALQAVYNDPAFDPIRPIFEADGSGYDGFRELAQNLLKTDFGSRGLNGREVASLLQEFGLKVDALATPETSQALADAIQRHGGALRLRLQGGRVGHSTMLDGAFRENGWRHLRAAVRENGWRRTFAEMRSQGVRATVGRLLKDGVWRFVVTDSNKPHPLLLSFSDLQSLDYSVKGVSPRIDPATGKPLSPARLREIAAETRNKFRNLHLADKGQKRSETVRTVLNNRSPVLYFRRPPGRFQVTAGDRKFRVDVKDGKLAVTDLASGAVRVIEPGAYVELADGAGTSGGRIEAKIEDGGQVSFRGSSKQKVTVSHGRRVVAPGSLADLRVEARGAAIEKAPGDPITVPNPWGDTPGEGDAGYRAREATANRPSVKELIARAIDAAQKDPTPDGSAFQLVAGAISDELLRVQGREGDCGPRAVWNSPHFKPLRRLFPSYEAFLGWAEAEVQEHMGAAYDSDLQMGKITPERREFLRKPLRERGTHIEEARFLYQRLGLDLAEAAKPADEAALFSAVQESEGTLFAKIGWKSRDADGFLTEKTHWVVVNAAIKELDAAGRPVTWFVVSDSHFSTPRIYTYQQLVDLRLEAAEAGRPKGATDAQLLAQGSKAVNDYARGGWQDSLGWVRAGESRHFDESTIRYPVKIHAEDFPFELRPEGEGLVLIAPEGGRTKITPRQPAVAAGRFRVVQVKDGFVITDLSGRAVAVEHGAWDGKGPAIRPTKIEGSAAKIEAGDTLVAPRDRMRGSATAAGPQAEDPSTIARRVVAAHNEGARVLGSLNTEAIAGQGYPRDCQIHSLYNLPELAPLRAVGFDRFSQRVAEVLGKPLAELRADGLSTSETWRVLEAFGLEPQARYETVANERALLEALAPRINGEGQRQGPSGLLAGYPDHAVVILAAYESPKGWRYVLADSRAQGEPGVLAEYSFDQLKEKGLEIMSVAPSEMTPAELIRKAGMAGGLDQLGLSEETAAPAVPSWDGMGRPDRAIADLRRLAELPRSDLRPRDLELLGRIEQANGPQDAAGLQALAQRLELRVDGPRAQPETALAMPEGNGTRLEIMPNAEVDPAAVQQKINRSLDAVRDYLDQRLLRGQPELKAHFERVLAGIVWKVDPARRNGLEATGGTVSINPDLAGDALVADLAPSILHELIHETAGSNNEVLTHLVQADMIRTLEAQMRAGGLDRNLQPRWFLQIPFIGRFLHNFIRYSGRQSRGDALMVAAADRGQLADYLHAGGYPDARIELEGNPDLSDPVRLAQEMLQAQADRTRRLGGNGPAPTRPSSRRTRGSERAHSVPESPAAAPIPIPGTLAGAANWVLGRFGVDLLGSADPGQGPSAIPRADASRPRGRFLVQKQYGYKDDPAFWQTMGRAIQAVEEDLGRLIREGRPVTPLTIEYYLRDIAAARASVEEHRPQPDYREAAKFRERIPQNADEAEALYDVPPRLAGKIFKEKTAIDHVKDEPGHRHRPFFEAVRQTYLRQREPGGLRPIEVDGVEFWPSEIWPGESERHFEVRHPTFERMAPMRLKAYQMLSEAIADPRITEAAFMDRMAAAFQLLAHATPFVRGTPSIVESFIDSALRAKFGKTLPEKTGEAFWDAVLWDPAKGPYTGEDFLKNFGGAAETGSRQAPPGPAVDATGGRRGEDIPWTILTGKPAARQSNVELIRKWVEESQTLKTAGEVSDQPTEVQKENDCVFRAIYNAHPHLQRNLTYEKFLEAAKAHLGRDISGGLRAADWPALIERVLAPLGIEAPSRPAVRSAEELFSLLAENGRVAARTRVPGTIYDERHAFVIRAGRRLHDGSYEWLVEDSASGFFAEGEKSNSLGVVPGIAFDVLKLEVFPTTAKAGLSESELGNRAALFAQGPSPLTRAWRRAVDRLGLGPRDGPAAGPTGALKESLPRREAAPAFPLEQMSPVHGLGEGSNLERIRNGIAERERQGLIFDLDASSVERLAEPAIGFNYVIYEEDGRVGMTVGKIEPLPTDPKNAEEVGVKHGVIAKGRKALFAGRASLDPLSGRVLLDFESGTFGNPWNKPFGAANRKRAPNPAWQPTLENARLLAVYGKALLGREIGVVDHNRPGRPEVFATQGRAEALRARRERLVGARKPPQARFQGRDWDIEEVTADGTVRLEQPGSKDLFVPLALTVGAPARWGAREGEVVSFDSKGLKIRLKDGEDRTFTPRELAQAKPEEKVVFDWRGGRRVVIYADGDGVARLSATPLEGSPASIDVPIAELGGAVDVRIKGRELDGLFSVTRNGDGTYTAKQKDAAGAPAILTVSADQVVGRHARAYTPPFGEIDVDSYALAAQRKASTARQGLRVRPRAENGPVIEDPSFGSLEGGETLVAKGDAIITAMASRLRAAKGPVTLNLFELQLAKPDGSPTPAAEVLEAAIAHAKTKGPDGASHHVRIVYNPPTVRPLEPAVEARLKKAREEGADIELVMLGRMAAEVPGITHAKAVAGRDLAFLATGGLNNKPGSKVEVAVILPPEAALEAAALLNEYQLLLSQLGTMPSQKLALLRTLAGKGIVINDPNLHEGMLLSRAFDGLLNGAQNTIEVFVKELQDPDATATLIDQARRGVKVDIAVRDSTVDPRSRELLLDAIEEGLPITLKTYATEGPTPHGNLVVADGAQAYTGTAFPWANPTGKLLPGGRAIDYGVLLAGERAQRLREQFLQQIPRRIDQEGVAERLLRSRLLRVGGGNTGP